MKGRRMTYYILGCVLLLCGFVFLFIVAFVRLLGGSL